MSGRGTLPLTGIRVVSMALNVPGPLAVSRLAAEGARVTKVEPPGGDPLNGVCRSWYDALHQDVGVERVDLKTTDGHERLRALLDDADLFVSSQRPSALTRLGIDTASTSRVRWLNIVGETAQPEIPGHDLTYQARAGLLGESMPVTLFADVMGSERTFSAALLLLRQPVGSRAEVGLYDSLETLVDPIKHGLTAPGGALGGGLPSYGVYRAKEGSVAIAALESHFRQRLYASLDVHPDTDLTGAMATRTAEDWERWARDRDLPLAAVRSGVITPEVTRLPPKARP